jgi:hypothetical protein
MRRVRKERIDNVKVRSRFLNNPYISDYIIMRTLRYIGKTIQNDNKKTLHKQFLTSFTHLPKHAGGQQKTHRDHVCFINENSNPRPTERRATETMGDTY